MKRLVVFVEGLSDKELLDNFLPRLFPGLQSDRVVPKNEESTSLPYWGIRLECIVFGDKRELLEGTESKLKGWRVPNSAFIIFCDQDGDDCKRLKEKLETICKSAEKQLISVRIACNELESWYFGNLSAVELALDLPNESLNQSRYFDPDSILKPSEELAKITNGKYRKTSGSRNIGKNLSTNMDENFSKSFKNFVEVSQKIMDQLNI